MGDHPRGHDLGERLYLPGSSALHRLPAHVKVLSLLITMLVIVATPGEQYWTFAGYALLVTGLVVAAGIPFRTVATRMTVEIPFVVFAVLMPFIGADPRVTVGPLSLSEPGLLAAWTLIAKATLGVVCAIVLAATTSTTDLIAGLRRLRLPDLLVQIFASMIRYVHVVSAEFSRMSRARAARGFSGKGPQAWPVLARSLGALFIRSYERGERVHLAMLSRGYTGQMPQLHPQSAATASQFAVGATLPLTALSLLMISLWWAMA